MLGKLGAPGILALLLAAGPALAADPEPVGSALKINSLPLEDDQGAPDVAAQAGGGFVAVFAASDADGKGIFARRYDNKGKPLGGIEPVNTTTGADQDEPAVASRANGDYVVVWQGVDSLEGAVPHVYARSFTAAGIALSDEIVVDAARGRSPGAPAVAMAPGGDFLVVWQSRDDDPRGSGDDVFGRLFEPNGKPLTQERLLNSQKAGNQTDPAVAVMASAHSQGFYVVWESDHSDAGDIYLQHLDLEGDLQLQSEALVNSSTASGEQIDPAIAVSGIDPDLKNLNRVAVVWEGPSANGQRIWYRLFDPAAAPASAETVADTDTEAMDQRAAAVALPAAAPEGLAQLVVTYTQIVLPEEEILGAPCVIVGARRPRSLFNLLSDDPEIPISGPGPITGASRISMEPGGGFVAVWQAAGPQGVGIDIFARRYAAAVFNDGFEDGSTGKWAVASP